MHAGNDRNGDGLLRLTDQLEVALEGLLLAVEFEMVTAFGVAGRQVAALEDRVGLGVDLLLVERFQHDGAGAGFGAAHDPLDRPREAGARHNHRISEFESHVARGQAHCSPPPCTPTLALAGASAYKVLRTRGDRKGFLTCAGEAPPNAPVRSRMLGNPQHEAQPSALHTRGSIRLISTVIAVALASEFSHSDAEGNAYLKFPHVTISSHCDSPSERRRRVHWRTMRKSWWSSTGMSALRDSKLKCCCSTRHKSEQARAMCWNSARATLCLCDVGALEPQPYARRRGLALTHPLRLHAPNAKAEPRIYSIRVSQGTRRESPATFGGRRPTRTDSGGCTVHLLGRGTVARSPVPRLPRKQSDCFGCCRMKALSPTCSGRSRA